MNESDGGQQTASNEAAEVPAPEHKESITNKGYASSGQIVQSAPVTAMQWAFLGMVSVTTAALDLWTKAWAVGKLSTPNIYPVPLCVAPPRLPHYLYQRRPRMPFVLINDYLDFSYAENCGGAWGLLHGAREGLRKPFFMLVTMGAVLFILHLYRSLEPQQKAMRWALPLVLGGALGNLIDRVRLGYVVDFVHAHWQEKFHWPTFNVADIAITIGIGLMVLEYLVGPGRKPVARVKLNSATM